MWSRFLDSAETIEAWAGAFTASLIGVFVCTIWMIVEPPRIAQGLSESAFLLSTVGFGLLVEAPFLFRLWRSVVRSERPLGPAIAAGRSYRSWGAQTVAALWWLVHLGFGLVFVAASHHQDAANFPLGVAVGMSLATCVASNVYLAMFVKAATNDDELVRLVWRYRLGIDVVLTGASLAASAVV